MATEVQICNMALGFVGVSAFIEALTDATAEAIACNLYYAQARDELLASAWWRFARRRAALAELSGISRTEWTYAYALPSDCLEPQFLWAGVRDPRPDQCPAFAIEATEDLDGRMLLTDEDDAELVYTAKVTAAPVFPPLVATAIAWLLADKVAMPLSVAESIQERAVRRYALALSQALAADARGEQADPPPDSAFIAARS